MALIMERNYDFLTLPKKVISYLLLCKTFLGKTLLKEPTIIKATRILAIRIDIFTRLYATITYKLHKINS